MGYLPVLLGYHASNLGNSHVALSLCRYWNESGREAPLTVPSADDGIVFPWLKPAMTGLKKTLVYKVCANNQARVIAENQFFRTKKLSSPVYLWPSTITDLAEHPEKRARLGEQARERSQELTWQKVAEQRAQLLEGRYANLF